MLVDDNATSRKVLQRQMTAWDLESDEADDGASALAGLRDAARAGKPYDLAIVDVQMPGTDGLELARQVRADPALTGLRLVLLSDHVGDTPSAQAARPSVQGLLHKPVCQAELYDAMCRLVRPVPEPDGTRQALPAVRRPRFRGESWSPRTTRSTGRWRWRCWMRLAARPMWPQNGQEAVEAVARTAYGLILMDCQMPVLDGFAATAAIRHQEQAQGGSHLPIVALTANVIV